MEHLCNEATKNVVIKYDKVMIPLFMKGQQIFESYWWQQDHKNYNFFYKLFI